MAFIRFVEDPLGVVLHAEVQECLGLQRPGSNRSMRQFFVGFVVLFRQTDECEIVQTWVMSFNARLLQNSHIEGTVEVELPGPNPS